MEEERAPQPDSPAASPTNRQRVSGGRTRDPEPRGELLREALILLFSSFHPRMLAAPCRCSRASPSHAHEDFFPFVTSVTGFVTLYIVEARIYFQL